jgi:predicted regulator of Ras-like GTPase activity (Roadblock/LC7/MglB family)
VAAAAPAPSPAPVSTEAAPSGGASAYDALQGELRAVGAERGMIGAVLLDPQGYVVAGGMPVAGRDRGPEIAAVLSPASSEAERAVRHLKLGGWKGILVETPDAVIRLMPTADGGMMAVAGRRDVPMGWVLRVAARARDAAGRFVAATGGGAP